MKKTIFKSTTAACLLFGASLLPLKANAFEGFTHALNYAPTNESIIAVKQSADRELEAQNFISNMAQKGIDFLANPSLSLDQRKSKFKTLLKNHFDMKTLARFSLGRYWNMANDSQKKEYFSLFEKNIIEVYSRRFGDYQGQEFKVVSARPEGKADAIVSSYIESEGQKITIDWRVRQKKGKMRVIDIIVEGVSMATTQRSEFASIIQRGGGNIDALIQHLKS